MQLPTTEVSDIYRQNSQILLFNGVSQKHPEAIILGGQPACGKSQILESLLREQATIFFPINGDNYRIFHPDYENLIKNKPLEFSTETQNFSGVFTENLIQDASNKKFSLIVEGTMRTAEVPQKTASLLHQKGYHVGIAVIAAHPKITELGIYRRYIRQLTEQGYGRLSDIRSHNMACAGLLTSVQTLYQDKTVDFINIYSYLGETMLASYSLVNNEWNNNISPIEVIEHERSRQINSIEVLYHHIQLGENLLQQMQDNYFLSDKVRTVIKDITTYYDIALKQKKGRKL
ncbi:hypothetical protein FACS1894201_10600 [Bacteroidia bacterium]|nr:hypothetical protein FACS1894201_10600 [Bacteroidia bacterium]